MLNVGHLQHAETLDERVIQLYRKECSGNSPSSNSSVHPETHCLLALIQLEGPACVWSRALCTVPNIRLEPRDRGWGQIIEASNREYTRIRRLTGVTIASERFYHDGQPEIDAENETWRSPLWAFGAAEDCSGCWTSISG